MRGTTTKKASYKRGFVEECRKRGKIGALAQGDKRGKQGKLVGGERPRRNRESAKKAQTLAGKIVKRNQDWEPRTEIIIEQKLTRKTKEKKTLLKETQVGR